MHARREQQTPANQHTHNQCPIHTRSSFSAFIMLAWARFSASLRAAAWRLAIAASLSSATRMRARVSSRLSMSRGGGACEPAVTDKGAPMVLEAAHDAVTRGEEAMSVTL